MPFVNSPPSIEEAVKGNTITNPHPGTTSLFAAPIVHDANDRYASLKTPRPPQPPADPTSFLPSSPPQIYLNLLIMEASLRSQYLTLRARRRQNTFVLTLLAGWIFLFTYLLWLRPRDDGKGIGGSKYWLVDMMQKVCFITGVVTALLFWATGQWERGVRWPRRWIGIANRGLRGMNAKIVVIRGPWYQELGNWLAFVMPFSGGLWGGETGGSSYHFINLTQEKKNDLSDGSPRHRIVEAGKEYAEEDIAPGGDFIKLLLLPKPFTSEFRQNWENFRAEYWHLENERRAELRKRVRARQREIAREEGGWLWWTGWRGWQRARGMTSRSADIEKSGLYHSHSRSRSRTYSTTSNPSFRRKRRPSTLGGGGGGSRTDGSHSRSSSRSTTPTPDLDDRLRPSEHRERRWSTSTAGSTAPRLDSSRRGATPSFIAPSSTATTTKKSSLAALGIAHSARQPPSRLASSGSAGGGGGGGGSSSSSRPNTPNEVNPWQSKRASTLSQGETLSAFDYEGRERERRGEGEFESARSTTSTTTTVGSPPPLPPPSVSVSVVPQGKRRRSREGNVFPNAPSA